MTEDAETLYRLLNASLRSLQSSDEFRATLATVTLGVLLRDFDFVAHPPEADGAFATRDSECLVTRETVPRLLETVQRVLDCDLQRTYAAPLRQQHSCHLLRCYFRAFARSLDSFSANFVAAFNDVVAFVASHVGAARRVGGGGAVRVLLASGVSAAHSATGSGRSVAKARGVAHVGVVAESSPDADAGVEAVTSAQPTPHITARALRVAEHSVPADQAGPRVPGGLHPAHRPAALGRSSRGRSGVATSRQTRKLAVAALEYVNSNYHAMFLPRVAPALMDAVTRSEQPSPDSFCALYSIVAGRDAGKTVSECKGILTQLLNQVFRDVGTGGR